MTIISIFCFMLAFIIVSSVMIRNGDLLSPFVVFGLTWSLAIGLADLKLSAFQHEWSILSWSVLLLGLIGFLVGLALSYFPYLNSRFLPVKEIRRSVRLEVSKYDPNLLYKLIMVLFVLYVFAFATEAAIKGNLPVFSERMDRARVDFSISGIHLLVNGMLPILVMIAEFFVFFPREKKKKRILFIVGVTVFLSFMLLLQRFNYIIVSILVAVIYYYGTKEIRWTKIVASATAISLGMWGILSIRLSQYAEQYFYIISKMKYGQEYAGFTWPYMYVVMNLENMSRGIDKLESFGFGLFTSDWLLALAGLKRWVIENFYLVERPFLVSGYNTFPYMWTYYLDFGSFGVLVGSLIVGFVIGLCYCRLRTKPSLMALVVYGFGVFFMAISFFTNPLTMLNTVFYILVLVTVHSFLYMKGNVSPADMV